MTIDLVRDAAIRAEPVRRLVEVAPSPGDLRSAIDEGLDVLGEGIGMVAERVDHSAGAIRERVPDQISAILEPSESAMTRHQASAWAITSTVFDLPRPCGSTTVPRTI